MKEKIVKALEFNALAYESVKNSFKRGMSEKDIKDLILSVCSACEDFSGDIVAGVRTAEIEGDATDYVLKDGDALILDLQFKYQGVWTDTTRTFFIGAPAPEVIKAYELCLSAKKSGENALKNGVCAKEIYAVVRNAFEPFEENFPHHAGHLFGVERVMQPQFLPERNETISVNDFVTLEPGIYFKDKFGIRVEDNYIVEENGAQNLFLYPLNIEYFVIK